MTTMPYEERLRAFAEGKRLGQLSKVVHDPEDGVCDACGSALPRTLFGLKDTEANRYFFVGQNCLSLLKASGLVARARYRQSTEVAYREEMEMRRNGAGAPSDQPSPIANVEEDLAQRRADLPSLRRTFFVTETESHYEALVRLQDGQRRVCGRAQEPRWSQGWARHDGAVVLLERVPRPRQKAIAICVLKAYRQARAVWRNAAAPNGDGAADKMRQETPA